MTLRRLLLVLILVAGFCYFITHFEVRRLGASSSSLTLTEVYYAVIVGRADSLRDTDLSRGERW